jgi:hypothetical protein
VVVRVEPAVEAGRLSRDRDLECAPVVDELSEVAVHGREARSPQTAPDRQVDLLGGGMTVVHRESLAGRVELARRS